VQTLVVQAPVDLSYVSPCCGLAATRIASSVREGYRRHCASGVNLLTFDAIPSAEFRQAGHVTVIVAF
jgi:hypothetical protein